MTKAIKSSTGAKKQRTWRNFFTAPALLLRVTGIGITPRGKDAAQPTMLPRPRLRALSTSGTRWITSPPGTQSWQLNARSRKSGRRSIRRTRVDVETAN